MRRSIDMEMIQFLENKNSRLTGNLAYAILSGICGTLILVAFLLAFLNAFQVMKFIPFIVAFNTAMTGYAVMDKCRERIRRKHLWVLSAGLVNVVITFAALTTLSLYLIGENLLGIKMFFLLLIVGAVCSELGALLATKYLKMKSN